MNKLRLVTCPSFEETANVKKHNFIFQTVLLDFDYCALRPESRKTHISSNASLSYPYALFTKQLLSDAKHAFSSTQFSSSVCVQRTHRHLTNFFYCEVNFEKIMAEISAILFEFPISFWRKS